MSEINYKQQLINGLTTENSFKNKAFEEAKRRHETIINLFYKYMQYYLHSTFDLGDDKYMVINKIEKPESYVRDIPSSFISINVSGTLIYKDVNAKFSQLHAEEASYVLIYKIENDNVALTNAKIADSEQYHNFYCSVNADIEVCDKNGRTIHEHDYVKFDVDGKEIYGWLNDYNPETKLFDITYIASHGPAIKINLPSSKIEWIENPENQYH